MNYRIPAAKPEIGREELANVARAVKSGWVSSKGSFIEGRDSRITFTQSRTDC